MELNESIAEQQYKLKLNLEACLKMEHQKIYDRKQILLQQLRHEFGLNRAEVLKSIKFLGPTRSHSNRYDDKENLTLDSNKHNLNTSKYEQTLYLPSIRFTYPVYALLTQYTLSLPSIRFSCSVYALLDLYKAALPIKSTIMLFLILSH